MMIDYYYRIYYTCVYQSSELLIHVKKNYFVCAKHLWAPTGVEMEESTNADEEREKASGNVFTFLPNAYC